MKVRFPLNGFSYGMMLVISVSMMVYYWGCKNNIVSTTAPQTASITGTVVSSNSGTALSGAWVVLTIGGTKDSVQTKSDGTFKFIIEVSDTTNGVNITLTVHDIGYLTNVTNLNVRTDISIPITLGFDTSTYAIIMGFVADSTTHYPLGGASILLSVPGGSDTTSTLQDGSYSVYINLFNLKSLPTTMTVTKDGFTTYRTALTLKKGTDAIDTVFLPFDKGSTIAHVAGIVTDSRTGSPIPSVTVILSSSITTDSTKTLGDGSYRFDPNLQGQLSAPMTLTFRTNGYSTTTLNFSVSAGQLTSEDVILTSNFNYATITGTVRDSTTWLPLSGASVIVALTGNASMAYPPKFTATLKTHARTPSSIILDSTTTFVDGSFSLAINLVDLDSVAATLTVSKPGFKVYQFTRTFIKGSNDLGNVPINIDNGLTTAHIAGYVTDSRSLLPITGVSVYLTTSIKVDSAKTSNSGSYSFDVNLQGLSTVYGTLVFKLNSYNDTTISFSVSAGQTLSENAILSAKPTVVGGDSSTARGVARSISLVSVSRQEISVHGVGRNETSVLLWQVLDSLGFPIDISHSDTVAFLPSGIPVTQDPQTTAYVTPTFGVSDGAGEVSTTVNSGTVAGTIQLVAKLTLSTGKVVQSSPVLITVDGGLPDQAHFEINSNAPHAQNFAGYDWSEVTQGFTVQAGDKYGNPVAPSTAIYFTTSDGTGNPIGGVMTAAGQTDLTGHANATLYSGKPLPAITPALLSSYTGYAAARFGTGTGYLFAKAYTQGENNAIIADSGVICMSATIGTITIDNLSGSDTVHSGGSIHYHVHIADRFGNPLESGTTVTATITVPPPPPGGGGTVWSVLPAGMSSPSGGPLTLPDNLVRDIYPASTGSTDFDLYVSATLTQGSPPTVTSFNVSIIVQGRNTDNDEVAATVSGIAVAP